MADSNVKLTAMANLYDTLTAELSNPQEWQELAKWVSENVLLQGAGILSAKELILSALLAQIKSENGYRWNTVIGMWQRK